MFLKAGMPAIIYIRLHNGIAHSDTHGIGQLACPAD
jgi:hypothetical protein